MTRAEAAKMLGISERTLTRYTTNGKIAVCYIKGKTNRIPEYKVEDVEKLKEELNAVIYQPLTEKQCVDEPVKENIQNGVGTIVKQETGKDNVVNQANGVNIANVIIEKMLEASDSSRGIREIISSISTIKASLKLTLSIGEAVILSGLSRNFLMRAIKEKKLIAGKKGHSWKIRRRDLENFINTGFYDSEGK